MHNNCVRVWPQVLCYLMAVHLFGEWIMCKWTGEKKSWKSRIYLLDLCVDEFHFSCCVSVIWKSFTFLRGDRKKKKKYQSNYTNSEQNRLHYETSNANRMVNWEAIIIIREKKKSNRSDRTKITTTKKLHSITSINKNIKFIRRLSMNRISGPIFVRARVCVQWVWNCESAICAFLTFFFSFFFFYFKSTNI